MDYGSNLLSITKAKRTNQELQVHTPEAEDFIKLLNPNSKQLDYFPYQLELEKEINVVLKRLVGDVNITAKRRKIYESLHIKIIV